MANQEQLEILNQGVEVWNRWRDENPEIEVDLSDTNFNAKFNEAKFERDLLRYSPQDSLVELVIKHHESSHRSDEVQELMSDDKDEINDVFDFRLVNFRGANLQKAKLCMINLRGADLVHANLEAADLRGAELDEAELSTVNLRGANLRGVNLSKALITITDFGGADLYRAIFRDALMGGVKFNNANLTEAEFAGSSFSGRFEINGIMAGGVDFTGANLTRTSFRRVKFKGASFKELSLRGASFNSAEMFAVDLSGADLEESNFGETWLERTNLERTNLKRAQLERADLNDANLKGADLREANLSNANLAGADLSGANLGKAILDRANLMGANLFEADISHASLIHANFVKTKIDNANISNSHIYGVSVWDLQGEFKDQKELIITPDGVSVITVDSIKVAQFVYLILNNEELRDVLNTLTSKTVLILGRFALEERKVILDSLRNKLREYDLLPIVFDFERPDDKDFTETIKTLAGMCYFVIADVTNPKSSPLELQATVPAYQIPFVPIIQEGERPFAMMVDLQKKYDWVLDTISYKDGVMYALRLRPDIYLFSNIAI